MLDDKIIIDNKSVEQEYLDRITINDAWPWGKPMSKLLLLLRKNDHEY